MKILRINRYVWVSLRKSLTILRTCWGGIDEWRISNTDYNSPEQVLAEAYYSVSCDYYLSAYLQYPLYRTKPDSDFLRPYFDLWRQGYGFTLDEDCLYLCK